MNNKIKNLRSFMVVGAFVLFTMCLFSMPMVSKAKEKNSKQIVSVTSFAVDTSGSSVPSEVKEPIEKGTSFAIYLVVAAGGIGLLIGIVLCAVSFLGHQPEMKLKGIVFIVAGIIIMISPRLADWLIPSLNWY